jgi:hypothetical protein
VQPPQHRPDPAVSEELQQQSVDVATEALQKYNIEKDIAMYCKKEFDRLHGTTWHCVVGKKYVLRMPNDRLTFAASAAS